jgi:hypothetical protein
MINMVTLLAFACGPAAWVNLFSRFTKPVWQNPTLCGAGLWFLDHFADRDQEA